MKYLALIITTLLIGCSTAVPINLAFPEVPRVLEEKCESLKKIEGNIASIIDYTKVVTLNYTTYYECAAKNDAWIEWYHEQKKIFEKVKK